MKNTLKVKQNMCVITAIQFFGIIVTIKGAAMIVNVWECDWGRLKQFNKHKLLISLKIKNPKLN